MILSGQSIRQRGIFSPFCERSKQRGMSYGLSQAGYDVRIDLKNVTSTALHRNEAGGTCDGWFVELEPGEFLLAATLEQFDMPPDVVGMVHDKSTWARQGLAVQNTVCEPGWRGYLTIELTNHGRETLRIYQGDPIAQIVLHLTDQVVERPYEGKYQDQARGPQGARYER